MKHAIPLRRAMLAVALGVALWETAIGPSARAQSPSNGDESPLDSGSSPRDSGSGSTRHHIDPRRSPGSPSFSPAPSESPLDPGTSPIQTGSGSTRGTCPRTLEGDRPEPETNGPDVELYSLGGDDQQIATTSSDRPTFLAQVNRPDAIVELEFGLFEVDSDNRERNDGLIDLQVLETPENPDLVEFQFPPETPALEPDRLYRLDLKLICVGTETGSDTESTSAPILQTWFQRIGSSEIGEPTTDNDNPTAE